MSVKCFIDTNIFIYSFDEVNASKRKKAKDIIEASLKSQTGVVSYQVVQEFLNIATTKFKVKLAFDDLVEYMGSVLMPQCLIYPDPNIYTQALRFHFEHGISFYDALIVAAASASGCKILYSEDFQHGRNIAGMRIQNPFV